MANSDTLRTPACQASLSMEILQARKLEWVVMPSSGDLPNPGINSTSLTFPKLAARFFTTSATWEAQYRKYIMRNARLDEAQAGIKIARRKINNFINAVDTTLRAKSEEELKSLLMKIKEESEKAGLKLSIQKTKIMASGPITSWQIDGETMKTVSDFIFLCSLQMVTAAMKLKETCSLSRKAMTNLDSI